MMIEVGKTTQLLKASLEQLLNRPPSKALIERISPNVTLHLRHQPDQIITLNGRPSLLWTWRLTRWYLRYQQIGRPPLHLHVTLLDPPTPEPLSPLELTLRLWVDCQASPVFLAITRWRVEKETGHIKAVMIDRLVPPPRQTLAWWLRPWLRREDAACLEFRKLIK